MMERSAFVLKVRKDRIDECKKHHDAVWSDTLKVLWRHGWLNYSSFPRKDGLLFGYFEAEESFAKNLEGMADEDANLRWQTLMTDYFEGNPGHPNEAMTPLKYVFHPE